MTATSPSPPRVLSRRRAGVLLPAASLAENGQGALGAPAYRFLDWLAQAGFSIWQLVPLVPVSSGNSPYWARSDRAGEPALTDPHAPDPGNGADFAAWRAAAADWLPDYALFECLSEERRRAPWWTWPEPLRRRDPAALENARARLHDRLLDVARQQWRFDAQWRDVRAYAAARGIRILGDLPMYVAPDSVATWTCPAQFQLGGSGEPLAVAGVPPDCFCADGQLWGNPLYRWEAQQQDGFSFWLRRLRQQAERFDLLRLDHFRALESYWAVPAHARTAREGEWRRAPGEQLLATVSEQLGALELVAEDLGMITPEVQRLRQRFELPGMRVLQFAFDGDAANLHLPHAHETNCVAYTGTHDNDTTAGWYASAPEATRHQVRRYLGRADHEVLDALQRAALASVAQLCVLPAQDLFHLGSDARLNRPGTPEGNWCWRLPAALLSAERAAWYRDLLAMHDRCADAAIP